jgi:simple sugar transport system substrate-binding protein
VDGIALTLAKPDAMAPAVAAATAAGIPVVALNAGFDVWKSLGVQQYFGQDETLAGRTAGERLTTDGAKRVLCIIHEQGNVSLESRCAGVSQGFQGTTEQLNVNSKDMPSVEAAVTAKLQQDPTIDHVIALDASIALTTVQSKETAGSDAVIDTFDTNAELVKAIKDGDIGWAIDQQPFLQGYLAIDSLWLYLNNRNTIGGGTPVLTGPAFIDSGNIDSIAEYAANGTR